MENISRIMAEIKKKYTQTNNIEPLTPKEMAQYKADTLNAQEGNLHLRDGYNCPICKNKGYISVLRHRIDINGNEVYEEAVAECKCQKTRRSIRRMKRSGLEELLKRYRFENYNAEEPWQNHIKEKAVKFAHNPQALFFIGGQSGAGKSHLCTAIARELIWSGKELRYMLWRDESVKLKSAINDTQRYQSIIEELKRVEVVYIDDFLKAPIGDDASKPSSADLSLALEIVNARYNANLITIISSEWKIQDIIDFDEALGGRIYELSKGEYCINIKKDKKRNYRTRGIEEI